MRLTKPQSVRTTTRKKPEAPETRVCEHPGCETILSRYNSVDLCWRHQDPEPIRNL